MTKSKILIVGLNQLPHRYLYNQCKYLADHFDITVISPYEGLEKKTSNLFKTVYLETGVPKSRFKLLKKLQTFTRIFRTIYGVRRHMRDEAYDLVYIWDQTWAFAIKLLLGPKHRYVMQMFAPGVRPSRIKNKLHDLQVAFNVRFFRHVFMGTERVMKFFKVPPAKAHATGVGIEAIEYQDRVFESLDLVYLGGLTNRYVPEFRGREIDYPRPPVRVFPEVPTEVAAPEEGGSEGAGSYNPDYGLAADGWTTLGTSGG